MRTAVCVWTVLLALVLGASETRAQTFPRDDQWRVLECDGVASFDPVADEPAAVDERDVVGDSAQPALYYFADADFLFLRMRVEADPRMNAMDLRPSGWAAELDTDVFFGTYELFAGVDGVANPDEVILARNTTQRPAGDPADPPEMTIATYPGRTHARGVEAMGAFASSFGGDADFFVDWAIARGDLAAENVLDTSLLALVMGTSTDAAGIDADIACHDGSHGDARIASPPPRRPRRARGDRAPVARLRCATATIVPARAASVSACGGRPRSIATATGALAATSGRKPRRAGRPRAPPSSRLRRAEAT